jgi:hypothetical protein
MIRKRNAMMQMESFFCRFSWGPRPQSIKDIAKQTQKCLRTLASIDDSLAKWRVLDIHAGKFIPLSGSPEKLLTRIMDHAAAKSAMDADAGHTFQCLSDAGVTCGIRCGITSPWLSNVCNLQLPKDDKVTEKILRSEVLMKIAEVIVNHWMPDYGVITSHECCDILSAKQNNHEAGWVTYLRGYAHVEFPSAAEVRQTGTGRLVLACRERFSSRTPKHMKLVRNLSKILEASGPA